MAAYTVFAVALLLLPIGGLAAAGSSSGYYEVSRYSLPGPVVGRRMLQERTPASVGSSMYSWLESALDRATAVLNGQAPSDEQLAPEPVAAVRVLKRNKHSGSRSGSYGGYGVAEAGYGYGYADPIADIPQAEAGVLRRMLLAPVVPEDATSTEEGPGAITPRRRTAVAAVAATPGAYGGYGATLETGYGAALESGYGGNGLAAVASPRRRLLMAEAEPTGTYGGYGATLEAGYGGYGSYGA